MSIQDIGAIGEIIGGLAVVVTLVVLILQVRQNTRYVKASAVQSVFDSNQKIWEMMMDPKVGPHLTQLNEQDRVRAITLVLTMRANENLYFQQKAGLIPPEQAFVEQRIRSTSIMFPEFHRFWNTMKQGAFSEEFKQLADANVVKENS